MKQKILDNIEWFSAFNKHWIRNIKRDNPELLSDKAIQIIDHTQHLLDVVLEDYIKLKHEQEESTMKSTRTSSEEA